jgi:hypothetical protein
MREMRAQKRDLIRDLDSERKKAKTLQGTLEAMRDHSSARSEEVTTLQEETRALNITVALLIDQQRHLTKALELSRSRIESLSERLAASDSNKTELTHQLESEQAHVGTLMQDLAKARSREQELTDQLVSEQALTSSLKANVNHVAGQLSHPRILANEWHTRGCSAAVVFPSNVTFVALSSGSGQGGASTPGVHGESALEKGIYIQQLSVKGIGHTLVGLVTSDAEKAALKRSRDYGELPFMTAVGSESMSVSMQVNMTDRIAKVFVKFESGGEVIKEITGFPGTVWVACAVKRTSTREVSLMPCFHWKP